ncbi:MAG: glycerophosphodiester phosphodiesterase [bacterium]
MNFAHRGFTAAAPENSLAAFKAAADLGVDGIELDVRTCKTGEVVVFHDPTVTRMTDGRGFVKNKTLAELKSLRIKYQNKILDEHIPTLAEVIEFLSGRALLNVEIKTNGLPKNHIEHKVVEILKHYGLEYTTIISSFNPMVLRRIKKIDREIVTGYLIDKNFNVRNSEISLTKLFGAKAVHLELSLAKEKLIKKIEQFGYFSVVWSVNDPARMKQLFAMGVNGMITDKPDLLKKIMMGP